MRDIRSALTPNSAALPQSASSTGNLAITNANTHSQPVRLSARALPAQTHANRNVTDDWLLIDYLMCNIDRHYNNFGVIRDAETLEVRPAPLFDTIRTTLTQRVADAIRTAAEHR